MAGPVRILLIASSDREKAWLEHTLREGDCTATCIRVDDEARCREMLAREVWDAVVCVFDGPRAPGALRSLRDRDAGIAPALSIVADTFDDAAEAAQRLGATVCLRGHGYAHLGPTLERALLQRDQRAAHVDAVGFEKGQRAVLEHIAIGRPLGSVLEEIVLLIEQQGDGMLCSILLFDSEAGCVRHGAAPHLPRELVEGVEGAAIGPREGSCGAAAYRREVVVIDDIGTHPNWVSYRHLALPFGLRACWSSPIFSKPGGDVLGTFAMYYREARLPTPSEESWVARATHLAAIAIGRDRAERAAHSADARYRQIVDTAYEGVWLLDVDARTLFVNQRTARLLGLGPDELIGRSILEFMDEPSRRAAEDGFVRRLRTISEQYEFQFRRKDGTSFWALVSGSPLLDESRDVVGALAMITDITALKRTEEALRRSEAEFRVVFENAAIGMALVDGAGLLVRTNAALQRLLGRAEGELAATSFMQFSHPDDAEDDRELLESFSSGARRGYQGERRFVHKGGAVVWGRLTASLVKPKRGSPGAVIAMVENVTERREMEEAVRASERLRSLMYGAASDVLFYIGVEPGPRFRFLSINPAFSRATGLAEAQVVGRTLEEVVPEPSRALVVANYLRAIHERRTIVWDEVTPYPAGTKFGEVSVTPIFDADGACTSLVGSVHDVTERRLAAQRLAAQAALLDKAKDAILVRDLAGIVQYWNRGAQRLFGWSSDEAVGRNILALLHREPGAFEAAQRRLVEAGQWSGELALFTKDAKPLVVEGSWTLIAAEPGRPASVLVINSDITARKSLEAQIFHAQRLESLGTLAGGLAHDFNNLLTVASGNVDLALGGLSTHHPAREPLSEAARAVSRGAELVRQLLTFSRREKPIRRAVELQPLVAEALGLLRVTIPAAIRVETRFDPETPAVLADPTQVNQIVMNLGTNALQAMRQSGGVLAVRVERAVLEADFEAQAAVLHPGTYARLVVSDTGGGIDAATIDHIFEPFYTTKETGDGTGLGLSVVHGIVEGHEGGIVVRSTPGQGTDFAVYLPAAAVVGAESGVQATQARP
jgi:PAS domain S-box-containing protein